MHPLPSCLRRSGTKRDSRSTLVNQIPRPRPGARHYVAAGSPRTDPVVNRTRAADVGYLLLPAMAVVREIAAPCWLVSRAVVSARLHSFIPDRDAVAHGWVSRRRFGNS